MIAPTATRSDLSIVTVGRRASCQSAPTLFGHERTAGTGALFARPRLRALHRRVTRALGLRRARRVRLPALEPLPGVDSAHRRSRRLRRRPARGKARAPAAARRDLAALPAERAVPAHGLRPPRVA